MPSPKKRKARTKRVFDPSKYSSRFIALKIAYLGHNYNGFEYHLNNPTPLPTIEEVLWKALVKTKIIFKAEDEPLNWEGCEYSKCGRTDKGVSAFGQIIALRVRSNRPVRRQQNHSCEAAEDDDALNGTLPEEFHDVHDELPYPHLLNRVLPPDIRILAWCPTLPQGFSARFSCRQRKYRYFFTQPAWCPMSESSGMASQWRTERDGWLDIEAMATAAKRFEGLHDFRNYCKQDPARQISNFERRIHRAEIVAIPPKHLGLPFTEAGVNLNGSEAHPASCVYSFDVSGSAFLWHQVRHMAAILFLVGQGFETSAIVDKLLDVQNTPRKPVYDMADDRPLVLWDSIFPEENTGKMVDSLTWIYPGDQRPTQSRYQMSGSFGEGRFGPASINEVLWQSWHSKKVDETLAAELLNIAATLPLPTATHPVSQPVATASARLFNGSGSLQSKGQYIPVMNRDSTEAPEVLNARWLENNPGKARKGLGKSSIANEEVDE